jgi:segregation and condensation protein B
MRLVKEDELEDEPVMEDETVMELDDPAADPNTGPSDSQTDPELPDGAAEDPGEDSSDSTEELDLGVLEALLLSTHHPLTVARLADLLDSKSVKTVRRAVAALNQQYESTGRSFRVEQVAGGYQILTLPKYGPALKALHQREADTKLTKPALETLAIIAYKQPILRADIEAIRGVACGETIRSLMEKHLVRIAGRAEVPGRPILYGTTKRFLELFGLDSLKDLPDPESGRTLLPAPPPQQP